MKREVLFRGRRVDNGELVYGFFTFNKTTSRAFIFEENSYLPFIVDENTISQFTGLKDKNGTRIFEGDKHIDEEGDEWIVFQMKCGRWALKMTSKDNVDEFIYWDKIEIIHE